MLDQTCDPSGPEVAATNGGSLLGAGSPVEERRKLVRRRLACAAIAASSLVWIYALGRHADGAGAISWSITLGTLAGCAAVGAAGKKSAPFLLVRAGERRPLTFLEAYALTYLGLSLVLCGWIVYHLLAGPAPPVVKTQIVDIELTSLADFADHHCLLPSTEEKPTLRKRTSPGPQTVQGEITTRSTSRIVVHGRNEKQIRAKADGSETGQTSPAQLVRGVKTTATSPPRQDHSPTLAAAQSGEQFHVYQPPHMVARQARESGQGAPTDESFMEEVAPPEMVELVDNEGDSGVDVWQAGGRSTGGKGAHSELTLYLKELNRRIKRAWSPPRGFTRRAEILFRIRKEGKLAMIKIIRSSGDADADTAAIRSITSCSPFRELPDDCTLGYLDIKYSFNYTADELSEVSDGRSQ